MNFVVHSAHGDLVYCFYLLQLSEDPKYDEYAEQPVSPGSRFRSGGPQVSHMNQLGMLHKDVGTQRFRMLGIVYELGCC